MPPDLSSGSFPAARLPGEDGHRAPVSRQLVPWLAALVAALVLGGVLLGGLERRSPGFRTLSFLRESNVQTRHTMLDPRRSVLPGGKHAYEAELVMAADSLVEEALAVQLRLHTGRYDYLPLEEATLEEIDGPLAFRAPEPARLHGSKHRRRVHLRLDRTGPVVPGAPRERRFRLRVVVTPQPGSAVQMFAAYRTSVTDPAASVLFSRSWMPLQPLPGPTNEPPVLVAPVPLGQVVLPLRGPKVPRAELLAFLWELPGAGWVRGLAVLAVLMVATGTAAMAACGAARSPGLSAVLLGAGTGLVFAGMAAGQALCAPPLSGHDEQDHLLSFLRTTGHPNPVPELKAFTRRNHWDRTWLSPAEKFSPDDRAEPYPAREQDWATSGLVMAERSGLANRLWRGLGWLVLPGLPGRTLLQARLLQSLLAGLAAGAAAALLALGVRDATARAFASLGLLTVPMLPYLAMSLSNYGLVTCAAMVLAGALGAGPLAPRWDWLRALGFGLALGLALQTSRSALSLLGVLPALAYRLVRRPHLERGAADIPVFWCLLGAGVLLPYLFSTPEYAREMRSVFERLLPGEVERLAFAFPVAGWIAIWCLGGMGIEALVQHGRGARSLPAPAAQPGPPKALGRLPAVLAAGWFLWFTFRPGPASDTSSAARPLGLHLAHNFHAFWSSFAAGRHDYDLSQTFWNSLDWLFVNLPDPVFDLLVASFAAGLVLGLARLATRPLADWVYWGGLMAGWSGCFALLLLASRQQGEPLIGRYLVAVYTVLLVACSRGWLPGLARLARWSPRAATIALATAATAVNGLALQLFLDRYF